MENKRNVSVIQDADGKNIVMINDIAFKGKRSVNWEEVKEYLKGFVGQNYTIASSSDVIYIGSDLPDEYTSSEYTYGLKGAVAKAKANATQGLGELIEIATNGMHTDNRKEKHQIDAANGWYKYDSCFALPVYGDDNIVERYNVFHVNLIIRFDQNGKKYLYDIINIKKRNEQPA